MNQLRIENLSVCYRNGQQALDKVNLEISDGMFGLLGPNGAGKSTLMRCIATLQEASEGKIFFNGVDISRKPSALRTHLGYLPQEFGVYPRISAYALLDHLAILKGIGKAKERKALIEFLLQRVNLYEQRHQSVRKFSGGMKQRIGIAQALLAQPKIIIVDEPTAGLDPAERNRFHNLLADLGQEAIVLISTHIVDDVKELCAQMAILHQGRVVFQGSPDEALERLSGQLWQRAIARQDLPYYQSQFEVLSHRMHHGQLVVHVLAEYCPDGFKPVASNLEDAFFFQLRQHESEKNEI